MRRSITQSKTPPLRLAAATSLVLSTTIAALLSGCAMQAHTPMSQSEEVMQVAWGPFARQCTSTRTSHYVIAGRSGAKEVGTIDRSCVGFAATPATGGAMAITGSTTADAQSSAPIVYRVLRSPNGVSRPASPGDYGLLAQGSDSPRLADSFARLIGLTQQQIIHPNGTLSLPIELHVPSPVQATLLCRPDGGGVDHGRETLVFSCTLDQQAHTDQLDARLQLAGVEEIDVLTGVRLSGSFAGSLRGYKRSDDQMRGRHVDDHIWYERTTEFE